MAFSKLQCAMNYFIIKDDRNSIEKIMENYNPSRHFDLLDKDLSKEEFFIYVVDIMYEVYAGNNILVTTTNQKGIKKLFETMNLSEVPNYCTMLITSNDDTEYLDNIDIDEIIVEEVE